MLDASFGGQSWERVPTGIEDLDRILGGYDRGSTILLEIGENVSVPQYMLFLGPAVWNFIANARMCVSIPSSGVDYKLLKENAESAGFREEEFKRFNRICVFGSLKTPQELNVVEFEGKSIEEDYKKLLRLVKELMDEAGQPVIHSTGVDTLVAVYGKDSVERILNLSATKVREDGNLNILILKSGYAYLTPILGSLVDFHLKIVRRRGSLLFYGVKPRTGLYLTEMGISKGYPLPKITPIL